VLIVFVSALKAGSTAFILVRETSSHPANFRDYALEPLGKEARGNPACLCSSREQPLKRSGGDGSGLVVVVLSFVLRTSLEFGERAFSVAAGAVVGQNISVAASDKNS